MMSLLSVLLAGPDARMEIAYHNLPPCLRDCLIMTDDHSDIKQHYFLTSCYVLGPRTGCLF